MFFPSASSSRFIIGYLVLIIIVGGYEIKLFYERLRVIVQSLCNDNLYQALSAVGLETSLADNQINDFLLETVLTASQLLARSVASCMLYLRELYH